MQAVDKAKGCPVPRVGEAHAVQGGNLAGNLPLSRAREVKLYSIEPAVYTVQILYCILKLSYNHISSFVNVTLLHDHSSNEAATCAQT